MPASIILSAVFGDALLAGAALGAAGYAAATFAINFVVSGIVARIFSVDPNANSSIDNGVRQQVAPATTNSLPIVYGDAYLGGTFVDAVLTTDQKYMYYVMAISSISPNGQFLYNRSTTVNAGSFAVGTIYTITTVGTTNFTLIGASANTVGVTFICTGAGTGTGTATKNNFYYGDRIVTFDSVDPTKVVSLTDGAGNVDSKISGNLYINLYTSTDAGVITNVTGTAPSTFMGGSDIATALRWTGTRQMNGLAFAIVKLTYSVEAGTTQLQPITFNVSHYLNNTGAAKPGDVWFDYIGNETYGGGMLNNFMPTTAAGSFIVGATYKIAAIGNTSFTSIGAVSNNVGVWFTATGVGAGTGTAILSTLINRDSAIALNTYSDATITYTPSTGGSATQVRYRINGVLDTGQNVLSNIDKIMLACDSWNQYNAASGQWTVVVNRDGSSSFSFDDTNIIGEIKTSLVDISNSINQIEASFPNKMNRDQRDFVYLETPSGLLYANEPVNKYSCSFDLVNESVQATYIANRMLEQAREDLIVTINAAYPAIQVDAGDVVSLTNSSYGWNNKLFRAMKVSEVSLPDGNLGASLDLSEYNASVYDDGSITQYSPTPNSNLSSVQFFSGLNPPVVSTSRPAATVPNFDVQITTPAIGRVTAIGLFYTTVATPSNGDWTVLDKFFAPTNGVLANSTTFTFPNMQLPANTYYFGALVMNETGQSVISGVSSSFIWIPSGTVGSQTAQVYLYQWAATTPTGPTGSSTYTWATATNSAYTGGGGWSVTIPTNPGTANWQLWQAGQGITAFAGTATTNVAWAGASITSIAQNGATGTTGVNGYRTGTLALFQWATSAPATYPSGTSTYTWATGAFTNPATLNGWTQSPGTGAPGQSLYEIDQLVVDQLTTATSNVTWASTTVLFVGGYGANGSRTATLALYQWAATAPITYPSGTSIYTWATGAFTNPATLNGWSQTPGTGTAGQNLYEIDQLYVDQLTTTTSTVTWSSTTTLFVGGYGANGATGTNGTRTATIALFQWAATAPTTYPSGTSTYTWATGAFTNPATLNGWSQTAGTGVAGQNLYEIDQYYSDQLTSATSTITWASTTTLFVGGFGANGTNGTNGTRTATLNLYQWAAAAPTLYPSGTSTYTWATGAFTSPATLNSWVQVPGAGAAGQKLYAISQIYTDQLTTATSTVTWAAASNYVVGGYGTNGTNGTNGTRTATLNLYQWALTAPTLYPSGTSTYTWATGAFTNPATLNSWTQTPGAGAASQSLYKTVQIYSDTLTAATSTVTWAASTATIVGGVGSQGNSAAIAYALYTGNPTVTGAAVVKTGTTLPATTDFTPTAATAFTSTVQTPASGQAMFQSDGIYNPVTNQTTWGTPYLSNLKVGNLSAISADMGAITAGTITLNSAGYIQGGQTAYNTGTGFFLGYSGTAYKFSIGSSTSNFTWDGSNINLSGTIYLPSGGLSMSGAGYAFSGFTVNINISSTAANNTIYSNNTSTTGGGIYTQVNNNNALYSTNTSSSVTTHSQNYGTGSAVLANAASGIPLAIQGSTSVAPIQTNSAILVTNLNAEYWNGAKGVGTVNNGTTGSLPTAFPPVTLTYNQVKYIQVNIGGVTGYIPIYI